MILASMSFLPYTLIIFAHAKVMRSLGRFTHWLKLTDFVINTPLTEHKLCNCY